MYVRVDAAGQPAAGPDGRVDVAYRAEPGAKLYRASVRNLQPTGDPADERPVALDIDAAGGGAAGPGAQEGGGDPIIIYTDGACSGNPGPMGIGVVVLDRGERREISEYLGEGTNNIAELTAILRALEAVPPEERERPVLVHSDSGYALGLLGKGWKAKKNVELVAELRRLAASFPRLRLVKVPGHAGVPENERCDQLATAAAARRR
ncbi:MAG TPA: ribonuclease H [Kofleriaceae bacterium]|nr:ribonuclease H [Kofleriaceae bacterium]